MLNFANCFACDVIVSSQFSSSILQFCSNRQRSVQWVLAGLCVFLSSIVASALLPALLNRCTCAQIWNQIKFVSSVLLYSIFAKLLMPSLIDLLWGSSTTVGSSISSRYSAESSFSWSPTAFPAWLPYVWFLEIAWDSHSIEVLQFSDLICFEIWNGAFGIWKVLPSVRL
jgi:hypothetical protein